MLTRDSVLKILEQNKGDFVSSRVLTAETGVSRNAVWKAVNDLKNSGYQIESVTNKGYKLEECSDIISLQAIEKYLKNKKLLDKISIFDELESTNMTAKMNVITGITDKKVIVARTQTAGVGHGRKKYVSPEGGIYLSIIKQSREFGQKKLRASDVGKTVARVIESVTGEKTELDGKTNRIYIRGKKVSGILTEYFADLETGEISSYIIGIGIRMKNMEKNRIIAEITEAFI
ncbi:MAG: HTH domain-containing protein [Eubacterium sp.]|nr:HTH domain-containing protein [Eubacterium sp.]